MLAVPSAQSSPSHVRFAKREILTVEAFASSPCIPKQAYSQSNHSQARRVQARPGSGLAKPGRRGSVSEIKIEVFSEGEKGLLVTYYVTKSDEVV